MVDQATGLRQLIQQAHQQTRPRPVTRGAKTIAFCSGKGGVGKSVLALNVGVALAQQGERVCLLDASLGLSNLDLLCGLNGYWNLAHVITGARTLDQVLLQGPCGVHLVPGASGLVDVADCPESSHRNILRQMERLEQDHDFLIVDTGTGIHRPIREFAEACDLVLVVTTPEPTSIADAYATVKVLAAKADLVLQLLVNQASSSQEAHRIYDRLQQTSRIFVRRDVEYAGYVPFDPSVPQSVIRREPVVVKFPDSPASVALNRLANRLRGFTPERSHQENFFARLWQRFARRAA